MNATKTQFSGTLYDGKSANKYPVTILLTKGHLELVFPNGRRIVWTYPTLKLSKTGSAGPVRLERAVGKSDVIPESLVIEDPQFLHAAHQVAPGALGTIWNQPHKRSLRYALVILALVVLPPFVFAIWMYAIPAMTNAVADRIPIAWEEKIGQNYFKGYVEKFVKEPDPKIRKALDTISQRLLEAVPDQPYTFRIYVHPSKTVNAFALPGGTIVVFQGLINVTETPEELAGVLAHEFQHVLKRHSMRNIVRSEAINIFATIISGNSDSLTNIILQAGGIMEFLRYSRELETQADEEGMKMVLATRVDPRGMVRVFEKLKEAHHRQLEGPKQDTKKTDPKEKNSKEKPSKEKESDKESVQEWMEYFSTHPANNNRIAVLKKLSENPTQKPIPLLPDFDWKSMHKETKESDESSFIF